MKNIFAQIPDHLPEEVFENLLVSDKVRVERILSKGHSSPATGWYDQSENEWVLILQGQGTIAFESGEVVDLKVGDFVHIEAHQKHRVLRTSEDDVTVWLAIFYS